MPQQSPEGLPSWLRVEPGISEETDLAKEKQADVDTPPSSPEPASSREGGLQWQRDYTSGFGKNTDVSVHSGAATAFPVEGQGSSSATEAKTLRPGHGDVSSSLGSADQPTAEVDAVGAATAQYLRNDPQAEVPRPEPVAVNPAELPTVHPLPTTDAGDSGRSLTPMGGRADTTSDVTEQVADVPARDFIGSDSASTVTNGRHHASSSYDLTPPPALDQSNLVNPVKGAPRRGWRKMLYSVTAGHINVGDSVKDLEKDALLEKIRRPMRGDYRIAIMSLKGGVGKTTTTVGLGGVFATVRHDRVIAIDANPDLGTLAQRVAAPGPATIRDLLAATDVSRYASVRQYTTQAESRLEVIGSERDPAISEAFSEADYRHAIDILQHHYNVILTDCGTGLMHSAMSGVLDLANTLVLVTSPALDGAQSASATLDWLNLHGYEQLAANAVVVVSAAHPGNVTIDMRQLINHFRSRTRAVHVIPFDRHLSEGAVIDLQRVNKETYRAYMELAAIVAEDFDSWHRHASS